MESLRGRSERRWEKIQESVRIRANGLELVFIINAYDVTEIFSLPGLGRGL